MSKNSKLTSKAFLLAEDYAKRATSDRTKNLYQKDLDRFIEWGGVIPSTPEQVAAYITEHADTHKPATLSRWIASISQEHRKNNHESPSQSILVRHTLAGIRNTHGSKQSRVNAAVRDEVIAMCNSIPEGIVGARNRAILLIGFVGALRRSEISGLKVENLTFRGRDLVISLDKSKTNQAGEDEDIGIPGGKGDHCAVTALRAWLKIASIKEGPVFRPISKIGTVGKKHLCDASVAQIIKSCALGAGLDPQMYSGHSLRAGLATSAAAEDKPYHKIKAQTRHKSDATLLRYIRDGEMFKDNAGDLL